MFARVTRWSDLRLLIVGAVGLAGCAADSQSTEDDVASSAQALGSCVTQPVSEVHATASSTQAASFPASAAVDGSLATRWSSGQGAPQWLRLDLAYKQHISAVRIDWETAFSPSYEIQVSDDAVSWATIRKIVTTTGGHQEHTGLDVDARYVRIFCRQVSGYGSVSILEVGVDAAALGCDLSPAGCGDTVRLPVVATQASTTEHSWTPSSAAADDVYSSRWSSKWLESQWLAVDLGAEVRVDQIRIVWEAAYAKGYAVESATSLSGPWTPVAVVTDGDGGVDSVDVGTTTRYLRVKSSQRGTSYGISIWELGVYGSADTGRIPVAATEASTTEFSWTPSAAAVDGNLSSRWSSQWLDNQWLALDLGVVARVDQVRINWEAAYARDYAIESAASLSGPWAPVAQVTNGDGGVDSVDVGTTTRYLRVKSSLRGTGYGISIWEIAVFGSTDPGCWANLLTEGWDPDRVSAGFCVLQPDGSCEGLDGMYALDPSQPNYIDLPLHGTFCPIPGAESGLTFVQTVTAEEAGTKHHLQLYVTDFEGSVAFGTCFRTTLNGVAGTNYGPSVINGGTAEFGCTYGNGIIEADIETPLAAGQSVDLTITSMIPGVAVGNTGCGAFVQSFAIGDATLTRVE